MDEIPREELARVGRTIVSDLAPHELVLFRMNCEEFFRDPKQAVSAPKHKEDALGFGAGDAVQLLTPWILMALTEAVRAFGKEIGQEFGVQARDRMRQVLRWLSEPSSGPAASLTQQQLDRVHAAAMASAGPDPDVARRIADSVLATLSAAARTDAFAPAPKP